MPKIGLASTSVYPESMSSSFELAARLGYDGIELLVGLDKVSTDIDYVKKLQDYHQVPVLSVHAPVLIVTQRTWSNDHWVKLQMTIEAADRLGADAIVVHPPFRWQGEYAKNFEQGLKRLQATTEIKLCVENMFPLRIGAGRMPMYLPSYDPTDFDFPYLTLDTSHASTSKQRSIDYVLRWGDRLQHLHLTDGSGKPTDEHLFPGEGDQDVWEVVAAMRDRGFEGHIVHEVNTRSSKTRSEREDRLSEALANTRAVLKGRREDVRIGGVPA